MQTARDRLQELDKEQGLLWIFDRDLARLAELQRSWLGSGEIVVRYEDLIARGAAEFERVLIGRTRSADRTGDPGGGGRTLRI